jgi:hypothetical protein
MSILSSAAQRRTRRKVPDQNYREFQKNLLWYAILSCYETIVANSEREMKEIMKSLKKYVRKKN